MNYHFLGPLCSSRVEYARPRRLLNVEMQWRVIVNDGQKLQQTVRLETCLKVKFIYSEKATKFCEIFPSLLTVCTIVISKGKISQNFVAFSEYMNFKKE